MSLTFFTEVPISCWVFKKSHFKWFFNNTIITINFFPTPIFHGFLEPTLIFVSEMHVQKTKCVSTKFGETHGRFMASCNTTKSVINIWHNFLYRFDSRFEIQKWPFEQNRTTIKAHRAALFCMSSKSQRGNLILFIFLKLYCFLFLSKESYSHGGLQTRVLGQTPLC